ncbi:MAG: vacJ like lipofamily protein [Alphaproteobacteria bacterium CG_4_9_14_3_um_filter_47_13]|nr:MAG: vacJ like lipofamily protein [Alphaproteobacteria bacterium CG_4_9_14_3_um_filter_47_13]
MAVFLCVAVAGCAGNRNMAVQDAEEDIYDPMENMNRTVFNLNDSLDRAIADPLARGYRAITPEFVRNGVRNFLRNLRSPVNLANQVLQGDIEGAAGDVTRFAMNTTIGIGGLFDVAADTGLEYEYEDFGQTLGVWGVDHGPYLVLPVMGPSSLRDSTGLLVDTVADPVRIYLYNTHNEEWYYARSGATALDKREELLDVIDDLRKNSFDYYAAIRSAYMQKRAALVKDDNPDILTGASIPDYDDE